MGYGRREPMVFSSIRLVLSLYPSLIRDIAPFGQFSFLFSTLWAWPKGICWEQNLIVFVMDPFHSINLKIAREAIFYGIQLLSAVHSFLSLFLLPSLPLSNVKPFLSSFLASSLCPVYILYQDLQTANLMSKTNPFIRDQQRAQKKTLSKRGSHCLASSELPWGPVCNVHPCSAVFQIFRRS